MSEVTAMIYIATSYSLELVVVDSLNRTSFGIVDKLSSRQPLDFIRSEGQGDFLCLILVLKCSMHMVRCLNMPSMPYCSMCMPIGWNGLSMHTEGCSECMPIIINF